MSVKKKHSSWTKTLGLFEQRISKIFMNFDLLSISIYKTLFKSNNAYFAIKKTVLYYKAQSEVAYQQ